MKDILVSIIVPIYNVEQYVEECVNSLLNQDHQKIEIILVDDGSKDSSGQIIDAFSQRDKRVRAIHKENGGVSSARNAGLDAAQGEYILFVDGDDYVDEDYVSYFLELIHTNHCELAMNTANYNYKKIKKTEKEKSRRISALQAMEQLYTGEIFVAVWNKIYKRSFLKNNGIRFDTEYWYGEGMLFNITCLQYVDEIVIGEKTVYHQIYNPDSAMRKFNLKSNHCGMRSMQRQKELWTKRNKRVEDAWKHHYRCFSYVILCGLIKTNQVEENRFEYEQCIKNLRRDVFLPMKVNISLKEKLIFLLIGLFPVFLAMRSAKKDMELAEKYQKELIMEQ